MSQELKPCFCGAEKPEYCTFDRRPSDCRWAQAANTRHPQPGSDERVGWPTNATLKRYDDRIQQLEVALRFYADISNYPTREIMLGNGQTVTGFGLGHIGPDIAIAALTNKEAK